ncbi:transferring glycosyl group transferase, partial [Trifolium pratense]
MAYGGGGFAISYPLAVALEKMQDRCIQRYPGLYGSDDRIQACMAELGVPLTKEKGFHQVIFRLCVVARRNSEEVPVSLAQLVGTSRYKHKSRGSNPRHPTYPPL